MLESKESASPLLTRAVAGAMLNGYINPYHFSFFENCALKIIGLFPKKVAAWLIPKIQSPIAHHPSLLNEISIDDLILERIDEYRNIPFQVPAIVMGSALGGATGHITSMVNGLFLPHIFVLTLKGGSENGDISAYLKHAKSAIEGFIERNRKVEIIQHYDPIHDGWLTKRVNHVRMKLQYLPEIYKRYIKKVLIDDGEIIILNCQTTWKQYKIAKNWHVQIGGWGGINDREFIYGSKRISKFCENNNIEIIDWILEGKELITGLESEWGTNQDFVEDIKIFCKRNGYRYTEITFDNPHYYAVLAFHAKKLQLDKYDVQPSGVVIEMFSQYDLTAVKNSALLPLWLIFNTSDSLLLLKSMKEYFPTHKPVFFSPLATFSQTPDMVPYDEWMKALSGMNIINIGARATHYPQDTLALTNWYTHLRKWVSKNNLQKIQSLNGYDLMELSKSIE